MRCRAGNESRPVSARREETGVGPPRNYLRPCVLLLLAEGTSHGYELLEQLGPFGFVRVDPGGLYRCLRAMDEEGLVSSTWQPSTAGPARRTYALTDEGREWLHLVVGSLGELARSLEMYRSRYQSLGAVPDTLR